MRVADLASELGNSKIAAAAFLKVAQLTQVEEGDPAPWYEKAYQEDSSDPAIAVAYGKSLLTQGQVGAAIFILEPQLNMGQASPELRNVYAEALLGAGRFTEAEPIIWELFEQNPARLQQVIALIGQLLDREQDDSAVELARKLEQFQRRRGERRQFIAIMQDITAAHRVSPPILEFLSELYNASNRENDYCQTLLKLFDLYISTSEFAKAAECLDRAAEVDPYESGHGKRLEAVKGKIDEGRFRAIASRFTQAGKSPEEPAQSSAGPTLGAATLQDLMLQAEILVQYGMRNKAVERLQRIQELFPREEERNEDLQRLYLSAGVTPRYAGTAALPQPAPVPVPVAAPVVAAPPADSGADVRSFTRVAEITRKLYQQSTAQAVLTTAVQEIGSHWEAFRCVAATGKRGQPPTAIQEFCVDGVEKASPAALREVIACLQTACTGNEPVALPDALKASQMQAARKAVEELGAVSILAVPLADGQESVGMLSLMHAKARSWPQSDVVVLKTVAEQMT